MPASKKKKADPCDDWEEQDYDSPTNESVPSPTSDRPSPSNALPSNHQPVSSSSNIHSDAPPDPIEIENSLVWNNASVFSLPLLVFIFSTSVSKHSNVDIFPLFFFYFFLEIGTLSM
ncbi:hypothetical protein PGTUg99_016321 [Puccinia graminis f. sp. tritici]|uniref:Uncharacterized protein n=1 Tax=Puccinia graminis f. sp. tritici TaxID=56615 RepID=A0A5B0P268_PUCGR|nr:hypothetical protein PGTUg99_016321 [Puccinia graminis f. sp. tritici]